MIITEQSSQPQQNMPVSLQKLCQLAGHIDFYK